MSFWKSVAKLVVDSDQYVLFRASRSMLAEARPDPEAQAYPSFESIPAGLRGRLFQKRWLNPLYHRLRRGQATLLCIHEGDRIFSYGWVQSWAPFRRKFGWLAEDGVMLGPYWTHPEQRGKGLYGRLLSHSLSLASPGKPALIYTHPENRASLRGIEKAGFVPLGTYRVRLLLRFWASRRAVEMDSTIDAAKRYKESKKN